MITSLLSENAAPCGEQELRALADAVCARGLAAPAVFFLELCKPLTTLGHSGMTICWPLCAALCGAKRMSALLSIAESRERVEQLIVMIERAAACGAEDDERRS